MKRLIAFIAGALIAAVLVFSFHDQISGAIQKPEEKDEPQTEQTETVAGSHVSDVLRVGSDIDSTGYYLKTGANVSLSEIRYKVKRDDDVSVPTYSITLNNVIVVNKYSGGSFQDFEYSMQFATLNPSSFMYNWSTNHSVTDEYGQDFSLPTAGVRLCATLYKDDVTFFTLDFDYLTDVIQHDALTPADPAITLEGGGGSTFTVTVNKPATVQLDLAQYAQLESAAENGWKVLFSLHYLCRLPYGGYVAQTNGEALEQVVDPSNGSFIPYYHISGSALPFSSKYFSLTSTASVSEDVVLTLSDLEKQNIYPKEATADYDGAWLILTFKDTDPFEFIGFNETAFLCSFSSVDHGTWADTHVPLSNSISTVTYTVDSWSQKWIRTGAYVKLINRYSGATMTYITALLKPDSGIVPIDLKDTDEDLAAFLKPYDPATEMLVITLYDETVPSERRDGADCFYAEYALDENAGHNAEIAVYVSKTARPQESSGSGFLSSVGGFFKGIGNGIASGASWVWGGVKSAGSKIGDFFFGDDGVVDTVKGIFSGVGGTFKYSWIILAIIAVVVVLVIIVPLFRRN